jgi:hypothetical protein
MEASQSKLGAALDPRRRIYRDPFNEMFVFILSATGAAVLVPVILLVVGAVAYDDFEWYEFIGASVGLELLLIFGGARPQMKPLERVGWALLWGFAAAVFGAAFYELVFKNVI